MSPSPRNRRRLFRTFFVLFALICLVSLPLAARAGGAGGSSSSKSSSRSYSGSSHYYGSSSSSGDAFFVIQIISLLFRALGPIPSTIIILLVVGGSVFAYQSSKTQSRSVFRYFDKSDPDPDLDLQAEGEPQTGTSGRSSTRALEAFMSRHRDFSTEDFYQKTSRAFLDIQTAWSSQNLGPVRRFISDGVYQRFSTQFAMMGLLEQKNRLSQVRIHRMQIQGAYQDGPFDVIEVAIHASMHDEFISPLLPGLNQSGSEIFTEYWSFIRRQDIKNEGLDLYQSTQCPHCGAQLPADLGETGQCPYCSSQVNSGEFDWVLSEITQEQDHAAEQAMLRGMNLETVLKKIRKDDPEFSVQLAEDKASNAYLQILRAQVSGQPEQARRFVSDGVHAKLVQGASGSASTLRKAYNRLFLNQMILTASFSKDDWDYLDFFLTASLQSVGIGEGKKVKLIDPVLREEQSVLRMKRKSGAPGSSKGRLYQHQCSSCGAPIQDSTDVTCPYCSQVYNSGALEWIVDDLIPRTAYQAQAARPKPGRSLDPDLIDQLYDVKDYAVNNLIIMAAADGHFAPEERAAIEQTIQRLHYPAGNLDALFTLARNGQLRLKMPYDVRKRQKIIRIMEDLASADGQMDPREQDILDSLKRGIVDESVLFRW